MPGTELILPSISIPEKANTFCLSVGENDVDRKGTYPWPVNYQYNSRGFRDREWPDHLDDPIWCLGDSFTEGVGVPYMHTWPRVIEQVSDYATINISLDGASNDWIARRAIEILTIVQPRIMVIHWSFFNRRERPGPGSDIERMQWAVRSTVLEDTEHFTSKFFQVQQAQGNTKLIHTIIPRAWPGADPYEVSGWWHNDRDHSDVTWPDLLPDSWKQIPLYVVDKLKKRNIDRYEEYQSYYQMQDFVKDHNIFVVNRLDLARDGFHYDILTARHFSNVILSQL